jgi:condensin complex subunit 1
MSTNPGGGEEDEMDCIGAEADDAEVEFIRNVCETEVVNGDTLLDAFTPLVVHICSSSRYQSQHKLLVAASLALAKLMLMSSEFCEKHLQLLFTLMEKSEEDILRANLIVAMGDLSFRFPNTLEPWTPNMYGRLRDRSPLVRSNTLTVLTHLILNDMIKVMNMVVYLMCIIFLIKSLFARQVGQGTNIGHGFMRR